MNPRWLFLSIAILFSAVPAFSMPPYSALLQKIRDGQVPEPIFMSDPTYKARLGIDQGREESLYDPGLALTNYNFLAILIGFSDQPGVSPPAYFDAMVFGVADGSWGPTLRGFYNRASYGNFNIITLNNMATTGWGTSPNNRSYYTAQGGPYSYGLGTYPNNSQGLCEGVVAAIDPIINFANYDNDGDGFVDGIILIHSGSGAEISGDTLDIWSHAWSIMPQLRDGVYISTYCVVPEFQYVPLDGTIGVFCHEFGHVLGLPDLYDYGYDSYGLGSWSLMAYGGWNGNGNGRSPAFLDAWSRSFLGFVTPVNITCDLNSVSIPAITDSAKVYRLWTQGNIGLEYYLLEYRSRLYTDTALAIPGLTIYHVDDSQMNNDNQWWPGQPPWFHYRVALEQADNLYDLELYNNAMDTGDSYPGTSGNPVFSDASLPSARDYFGAPTFVGVYNMIFYSPSMAAADLDVGATGSGPPVPTLLSPPNSFASFLVLQHFSWTTDPNTNYYHLQIDNAPDFATPIYEDSMIIYNYVDYSFGGQPDGQYFWHVRGRGLCGSSPWSNFWTVFIDRQLPYGTIASSPDTSYSSSFQVSWTPGSDPPPSSGICSYSVLCDSGAGPAWYWLSNVPYLSATFTGARNGNTYVFCAMAHDCAGNQELWNWQFECTTYVEYSGCPYLPGDINGNGSANGIDVTYGVSYLKGGSAPKDSCYCPPLVFPFYAAMDVNGNCAANGIDITYFVSYLKGQQPALLYCADCPPAGMASPPGPAVMPIKSPTLKSRGMLRQGE